MGDAFQKSAVPVIEAEPDLQDLAVGNFQQFVEVQSPAGKVQEIAWALTGVKGAPVSPTMLEGRWPEGDDEVALGAETLRTLGVSVGDTVTVVVGNHRTRYDGRRRAGVPGLRVRGGARPRGRA